MAAQVLRLPEQTPAPRRIALPAPPMASAALPPDHAGAPARLRARGKFIYAGDEKFYLRGVTYGTFADEGDDAGARERAAADLDAIAASPINTIRTYTVPSNWLLDLAGERGLKVLIGVPWQQHTTFLDDRELRRDIERTLRDAVRCTRDHEAVAGYVVGNEIPAGIVRWHGRRPVEQFIERLYLAAKDESPAALVTYANFPSTEYLQLPFLDVACFNVFLEDRATLAAYIAHLQVLVGDRPLVISELGLDSRRHGVGEQAHSVAAQVGTAFEGGCAGTFVFAWTDEWSRGGFNVEDWDFGLVTRTREPKPVLDTVEQEYAKVPFATTHSWPAVSVVVCTHNGAATIRDCLASLKAIDYPRYEVVVVDDGSDDGAGDLAAEFGVRVIRTENQGLSAARNTGVAAAVSEIIAFCDDDCAADPQWLRYLVRSLLAGGYAGVGGPNIPPPGSTIADSVGHSPGGPMHVLLSDTEAEHIPGCNMAFHRAALEGVGGFDERFWVAGDDVDVCWRIQNAGGTLGFSPAALIWHKPRPSVRAYAQQQIGYGRAEALLERKWPHRYNGNGHLDCAGRVYGGKPRRNTRRGWLIDYGVTGGGLFQSIYAGPRSSVAAFPLAPEWYLLGAALTVLTVLGLVHGPASIDLPIVGPPAAPILLALCALMMAGRAAAWASAVVLDPTMPWRRRAGVRALIGVLCLIQPMARLWGRVTSGLTPWRGKGAIRAGIPRVRTVAFWSESWKPAQEWAETLAAVFAAEHADVSRGGTFDTWDFEVRGGALGSARVRLAAEEHGRGRQMVRFRIWPRIARGPALIATLLAALAALSSVGHAVAAALVLLAGCAWLAVRSAGHAASSVDVAVSAADSLGNVVDATEPLLAPAAVPEASS